MEEYEEWKPIPGYEGIYEASNVGRIRTAPGKTTSNARYDVRIWKTRVMKPKALQSRQRHDLRVTLWKDGSPKDYLVSRLVASAWIGSPADGMTVNHINGNYLDNRPENLEWVSLGENIKHGFGTGLYSSIQKPVSLIDPSGKKLDFSSCSAACRFLERNHNYLCTARRRGQTSVTSKSGLHYGVSVQKAGDDGA